VQRREHEVSGKSDFDGDFRGFEVADLADQNDVRVLAQETKGDSNFAVGDGPSLICGGLY